MWHENPASRQPLGELEELSGGVGLLGMGPVVVAAVAVLLPWRSPLVLLLAASSGAFLLAALTLFYEPFPGDITRMDGHARNFALVAVLLALGIRLATVRSGYRYAAAASLIALVTWPTAASPARALSLGLERGAQLSIMSRGPREFHEWFQGRHAVKRFKSDTIADFIREHTPADARVLSPHPDALTIAAGRPSASGFAHLLHIIVGRGPEYNDALRFLEPAAIRQLGIDYVHATETCTAELPNCAQQWLVAPELFELLARDGADALYRVRPTFLNLNAPPARGSFEALRRAIPGTASVYISPDVELRAALRIAATLPHAQLFGDFQTSILHMLSRLRAEPLDDHEPDLVDTSFRLAPATSAFTARRPLWWNDGIAVHAPTGTIPYIMDSPTTHFSVRLSDVREQQNRISFTATFIDRATDR